MAELHTSDADFQKTFAYLQNTLDNGDWEFPKLKSTLSRNLNAAQPFPAFNPMATHIQDNSAAPVANQVGRLKLEPDDILTIPHHCLQLAKATELLFHDIPDHLLKQCIPKDVKKYTGRGYDTIFFENNLKNHVANISRKTLKKGFVLTKMLVFDTINTAEFRAAMRDANEKTRVYYFRDLVTNDHVYHLYSDQWKGVSFDFVHHEGVRTIPAEERLRDDLQRFIKLATGVMLYDFYRYCIQMKSGGSTPTEPDVEAGWDYVVVNYKAMPGWGPLGRIIKTLDRLPAAPNFTKKKQVRQARADVALPEADDWSD